MKSGRESTKKGKQWLDLLVSKANAKGEGNKHFDLSNLKVGSKFSNKKSVQRLDRKAQIREEARVLRTEALSNKGQKEAKEAVLKETETGLKKKSELQDQNNNLLEKINESDGELSSGDERLSKAFGIDRSLTIIPRIKSFNNKIEPESPNEEQERSMLTNELRTLSFLNEDEEEQKLELQFQSQKSKFKNRLKKNKLKYNGQDISSEVAKNKKISLIIKKETSIFSTQESKKNQSDSFKLKQDIINSSKLPNRFSLSKAKDYEFKPSESSFSQMNRNKTFHHENNNNHGSFTGGQAYLPFYEDSQWIQSNPYYSYYNQNNLSLPFPNANNQSNTDNKLSQTRFSDFDKSQPKNGKKKRNYMRIENTTEYDIDLKRISEQNKTTLMIRNIPNKYSKELMLDTIDELFKGCYDFFYLPIDFKNNCNVGYAFINFKDLEHIKPFFEKFNGKRWACFNSEKICSIKYARIQGKQECEVHFKDSSLMKQPVS